MDTDPSSFSSPTVSSPSVIVFEEYHHSFNPGVKVSCFAFAMIHQVSLDFAMFLVGFSPFGLHQFLQ
jgi:hypothetical protein